MASISTPVRPLRAALQRTSRVFGSLELRSNLADNCRTLFDLHAIPLLYFELFGRPSSQGLAPAYSYFYYLYTIP